MRLLGIDYGEKRVGIAFSDEGGTLAFPYGILKNDSTLISRIKDICDTEKIGEIVIGESRTYTGEENPITKKINQFKKKLEASIRLPVVFELEFLSTQEARRIHKHKPGTRLGKPRHERGWGKQEQPRVDDSAAALILQRYLDKKYNNPNNPNRLSE